MALYDGNEPYDPGTPKVLGVWSDWTLANQALQDLTDDDWNRVSLLEFRVDDPAKPVK